MSRRAKELSDEQKAIVRTVRRLARQRAVVNDNYISSILQARSAGVTYSAIAAAVGTSSQAVQEIVRRHGLSIVVTPAGTAAPMAAITEPVEPATSKLGL